MAKSRENLPSGDLRTIEEARVRTSAETGTGRVTRERSADTLGSVTFFLRLEGEQDQVHRRLLLVLHD